MANSQLTSIILMMGTDGDWRGKRADGADGTY